MTRYALRKDVNEPEIVAALRAAGAYVYIIGLPVDLLVGYKGHTFLMEIKRDAKARKTNLQEDFFYRWTGGTLCRIDSVEAALRMLNTKG